MKSIKLWGCGMMMIGFAACESGIENQVSDKIPLEEPAPGSDRDEYGCIGSAGYQWSVLKNECIRVFASGIRLDPQDSGLDQTTSAFVVFADEEQKQAEVYLPSNQKSLLLNKTDNPEGSGTWIAGDLELLQWRGMYILDKNEKTIYRGPAVR